MEPAQDSDMTLFELWRAGDLAAGNALVTRYFGTVRRLFATAVGHDDRQDLVQETFARLMRAKESFRQDCTFRTFLFSIARHVLHDHLRARHREQNFDPLTHSVEDVDEETPSRAVAMLREYGNLIERMRALPIDTKMMLEMYYWHDLTANELGEIYGISAATVRTRMHAARKRLKRDPSETPPQKTEDASDLQLPEPEDSVDSRLRAIGKLMASGPTSI
jgi:RNA polymerase sigma-70 factor (ECF subfamily)